MIPPPSACYVLWQTKARLVLLPLSIVSLSILCPPPFFSHFPASQTTENLSLFVNWPGSGERIVAKCSVARLSLTFRLFCSMFHSQTQNPTKTDKAQPLKVCLSVTQEYCSITASLIHRNRREEDNHREVSVVDSSTLFPTYRAPGITWLLLLILPCLKKQHQWR